MSTNVATNDVVVVVIVFEKLIYEEQRQCVNVVLFKVEERRF